MKERVSTRTHSNRVAVQVLGFIEKGETFYSADFATSGGLNVAGRHKTIIGAQEEADRMMGATHKCSAACTPWTSVQRK